MNDNTIPLSHLALEIGATADELAARVGDRVIVDVAAALTAPLRA